MTDELASASPNCPECLHRLEAVGLVDEPFWWCPQERIAVLPAAVTR